VVGVVETVGSFVVIVVDTIEVVVGSLVVIVVDTIEVVVGSFVVIVVDTIEVVVGSFVVIVVDTIEVVVGSFVEDVAELSHDQPVDEPGLSLHCLPASQHIAKGLPFKSISPHFICPTAHDGGGGRLSMHAKSWSSSLHSQE